MPEGCANPASRGDLLLRFSSQPVPTIAAHVPAVYFLKYGHLYIFLYV